jgi:hypothetical protein
MDPRETDCNCVEWACLTQVVGCCEHSNEPLCVINSGEFLD